MFYYLDGTIAYLEGNFAVVDCNGVGYACSTTSTTTSNLKVGTKAKLFTYLNVREDSMDLFGFYTVAELNMFKLLISVSGVGPKAALSILSSSNPEALTLSITMGDERALTAAQGIGKKIAQRIILELKDKMMNASFGEVDTGGTSQEVQSSLLHDVHSALSVLGYNSSEISNAIKQIDYKNLTLEETIRQALKKLAK